MFGLTAKKEDAMRLFWIALAVPMLAVFARVGYAEEAPVPRDYTCFQTAAGYAPALDIGSDVAVVYGTN